MVTVLNSSTYSEGEDTTTMAWSDWCSNIDELSHRGVEFGNTPVSKVMSKFLVLLILTIRRLQGRQVVPFGRRDFVSINWYVVVGYTTNNHEEVFAKGVHRAPIISAPGHIMGLVSQVGTSSLVVQLTISVRHSFHAQHTRQRRRFA